ncbi:TetR/AcrR family transcriptional regulator [Prauserella halophila]|uniref:TetR/AcrR family transcriptional regulator n=1 Tax=Prauserella halophila TaxID=185641 RepID=A0ABN1W0I3_9PSEU|nr:TetR/AcrR family transcriptional regulator [Prauserella halophila]MCP2238645.1 transcriptional regulator, TetR family [Prauserella halophila]
MAERTTRGGARRGGTGAAAERAQLPVRDRILDAADELFYAEGIRAVSADRIIAAASVSKVTFYRHFPTKDDLVVAYLELRASVEREAVEALRTQHAGDPEGMLTGLARELAAVSCAPGFRGCPYINAAAEYSDPAHVVRRAVTAHRAWFAGVLQEQLGELGVTDPAVAEQLMMLRDGAMVHGDLGGSDETRAQTLLAGGRAIIRAAR